MFSLTVDPTEDPTLCDDFRHEDGKRLVRALGISRDQKVLDIGCGAGRLGEHVGHIVGAGGEVVGVDPLPLRVAVAARRHPGVFKASVGPLDDLASQFEPGYFDAAYLNSVPHWGTDQARVLREAHRVLRRHGRLGVSVANRDRPDQRVRILLDALSHVDGVDLNLVPPDVPHAVGWRQLSVLINQAGFSSHTLSDEVMVAYHASLDDVLSFNLSSAFGNFLHGLEEEQYEQLRQAAADKLAPFITSKGIRLERYLIFAVAHRHR